ncbi:NAD(P)-dependent oxidoreductase, partial [Pseudooctadecabacter sp.]|uniref:NAD(P)-dependent oxidoreductase n=1 Tax=Pseudooctadecabacter sp. TaxID=1966338 RepID=UPI0035C7E618
MIPVQGVTGKTIAVLGLGRSGLATVTALQAGGAQVVVWDDSPTADVKANDAGADLHDLTKQGAFDGIDALITSPGIPHLYPDPHPAIANAMAVGVPVDNDIGLFFRSFATAEWDNFDTMPKVIAVTGSNGKSTTSALSQHLLEEAGRPTHWAGTIGR